jgi:WXG100 family type VII secretion target
MANRLLVSPEALRDTAQAYRAAQAEQAAACQAIRSTVDALQGSWTGKAAEAFLAAFRTLYSNLEASEGRMQDAAEELLRGADVFEQSEQGMTVGFAGLQAGTNPFQSG